MGSVVTKDVEDYAIVAGCPARVIRKRFDDDTITKLLATAWWDFSDEKLARFAKYFVDPQQFLEEVKKG